MRRTVLRIVGTVFLMWIALSTTAGATVPEGPAELFEQPMLIASAGQSAEVQLVSVLAKKAGLAFDLVKLATGKDLVNHKTLALVIGASLKGLGAAGLDTLKEKERISVLLYEARAKNIPILCLHLGGDGRRGQLTDEMITEYLPLAKMAIILKSGNKDEIFTKICRAKNIPLVEVEKTLDAVEPLKAAFKK